VEDIIEVPLRLRVPYRLHPHIALDFFEIALADQVHKRSIAPADEDMDDSIGRFFGLSREREINHGESFQPPCVRELDQLGLGRGEAAPANASAGYYDPLAEGATGTIDLLLPGALEEPGKGLPVKPPVRNLYRTGDPKEIIGHRFTSSSSLGRNFPLGCTFAPQR
jgi:hypothetical protein